PIQHGRGVQGTDVEAQRRTEIIGNDIVYDDRLSPADKDGRRFVEAAASASRIGGSPRTGGVELQSAIGQTHVRLMNLKGSEVGKTTFDSRRATAISDHGMVETGSGGMPHINSPPVSRGGCLASGTISRVEGPASSVTRIV